MTAATLNHEFLAMRLRFQRTLALSAALHALLLLWLAVGPRPSPPMADIVEIAWLAPAPPLEMEAQPASPPAPSTAAAPAPRQARPTPQQLAASRPDMERKLEGMRPQSRTVPALTAATAPEPTLRADLAMPSPPADNGPAVALRREQGTRGRPRDLTRGPAVTAGVLARLADPPRAAAETAPAAADEARSLDGVLLTGPAANRTVVALSLPTYPSWAKQQAVEATVTLHFVVLPDGRVKENVQVIRSAGYRDFDDGAVAALRTWRFVPLSGTVYREQWGTVTFAYKLRD